jgi:Sec-independent protein translocase protein TatA
MAKEAHMAAEIFGVDGVIVLIVVLVLLFGGAAIPKLARNLGSAKNEFEKGIAETKQQQNNPPNLTVGNGATANGVTGNGTVSNAETAVPAPAPVSEDPQGRS